MSLADLELEIPLVLDALEAMILAGATVEPCGSRVTCDPPPGDSDRDLLVEIPAGREAASAAVIRLDSAGFSLDEGSQHYQDAVAGGFMSWRYQDINVILTSNADFAHRHRVATALCKRLNLLQKPDRIAVFQAVLYGKTYSEG